MRSILVAKWFLMLVLLLFGAVGCAPPAGDDGTVDDETNTTMVVGQDFRC